MLPAPHTGLEWLLVEQTGVLTTAQANRHLHSGIVRSHLGQGRWRRVCRGVLLTENGRLRPDQQLWVAVLAAGPGAVLAGSVAAAQGGVRGLRTEPIDVLVPAARSRSLLLPRLPPDMAAVRVHRSTVLPDHHQRAGNPPRTSVARSTIDGAAWARGDHEARELIARAHQQGRVTVDELREVLGLFPRIRRHRLISTAIADAAGGATALSEVDLVALCRKYRITPPDLQFPRTDETGRRRFVDAHWADARLLVEVDGSHHMRVEHWTADMLRQNRIWISGDRILRFPASLVRTEPHTVAAQIQAALRAARTPPPRHSRIRHLTHVAAGRRCADSILWSSPSPDAGTPQDRGVGSAAEPILWSSRSLVAGVQQDREGGGLLAGRSCGVPTAHMQELHKIAEWGLLPSRSCGVRAPWLQELNKIAEWGSRRADLVDFGFPDCRSSTRSRRGGSP